jgi:hypothetical protein
LPSFFFCASLPKRKSGNRFLLLSPYKRRKICIYQRYLPYPESRKLSGRR